MVNMMKLMKQAQDMQKNMAKVQAELAEKDIEFSAGGGAVTATVKGDLSLKSIKIDPKVVDPADAKDASTSSTHLPRNGRGRRKS